VFLPQGLAEPRDEGAPVRGIDRFETERFGGEPLGILRDGGSELPGKPFCRGRHEPSLGNPGAEEGDDLLDRHRPEFVGGFRARGTRPDAANL
jgi:hypothetical protein